MCFYFGKLSIITNISIDYAIMEKADNVYTIPGDFGWSDLGLGLHFMKSQKKISIIMFFRAIQLIFQKLPTV